MSDDRSLRVVILTDGEDVTKHSNPTDDRAWEIPPSVLAYMSKMSMFAVPTRDPNEDEDDCDDEGDDEGDDA